MIHKVEKIKIESLERLPIINLVYNVLKLIIFFTMYLASEDVNSTTTIYAQRALLWNLWQLFTQLIFLAVTPSATESNLKSNN